MIELETIKTLDSEIDLSDDLKQHFLDKTSNVEEMFLGFTVWVDYTIGQFSNELEDGELDIFDEWLLENTDARFQEMILIKHQC